MDSCHLAMRWPGRDYYNPELEGMSNTAVENPFVEGLDRSSEPRMPWHDVHMSVDGEAARDVALNFIQVTQSIYPINLHHCNCIYIALWFQRWNHHRDKKDLSSRMLTPYLLPSAISPRCLPGTCECHVVRSLSDWSGCNRTEDSVANAYYELINVKTSYLSRN